jgi:GNAT superfamily N-acetyltransferase
MGFYGLEFGTADRHFIGGGIIVVEIITASEKDIPVIEEILMDTVRWLDSIGQPLWREDQITWARLSKDFSASDFYIALLDGLPAACMAVVDYDPEIWPDIRKGSSLFIHKLAVKRFAAGKGLSDALISHAKAMCLDRGIAALRLDCHSLIPKLRAVYERNGFVCVDEKVLFGKYHTALYKNEVKGR